MMSFYVLTFVLALSVVNGEGYDTKNDNFDIKGLIDDTSAFKVFVGCFLDREPCSPVAAAFLKDIPDSVNTSCAKCNEAQKTLVRIFVEGMKTVLPKEYIDFKKKFDPEDKHFASLEATVNVSA